MNGTLFGSFERRSRPCEFRFGNHFAPRGKLKRIRNVRRQLSGVFAFRFRLVTERLLLPGIRRRETGENAVFRFMDVVLRSEDLKFRVRRIRPGYVGTAPLQGKRSEPVGSGTRTYGHEPLDFLLVR